MSGRRCVLILGSIKDGMQVYGPFKTEEEAEKQIDHRERGRGGYEVLLLNDPWDESIATEYIEAPEEEGRMSCFDVDPATPVEMEAFREAVRDFKIAARRMHDAWDHPHLGMMGYYPFDKSFTELIFEIEKMEPADLFEDER